LLSPYAPHLGEELWEFLGHGNTIAYEKWPVYNEAFLKENEVEIVVQVNGKVKGKAMISPDASQDDMKDAALAIGAVKEAIEGKRICKTICVPGRLVNFVVG